MYNSCFYYQNYIDYHIIYILSWEVGDSCCYIPSFICSQRESYLQNWRGLRELKLWLLSMACWEDLGKFYPHRKLLFKLEWIEQDRNRYTWSQRKCFREISNNASRLPAALPSPHQLSRCALKLRKKFFLWLLFVSMPMWCLNLFFFNLFLFIFPGQGYSK